MAEAASISCAAIDFGILFEEPSIGCHYWVGVLGDKHKEQLWPCLSRVPPLILAYYLKSRPLGSVIGWVSRC